MAGAGSNINLVAGSGNVVARAPSAARAITLFGGSGSDSLIAVRRHRRSPWWAAAATTHSRSATAAARPARPAPATTRCTSSGGTGITMFGGSGNDHSLASSGGSAASRVGGSGNDSLLLRPAAAVDHDVGGTGNDTLSSSGGTSASPWSAAPATIRSLDQRHDVTDVLTPGRQRQHSTLSAAGGTSSRCSAAPATTRCRRPAAAASPAVGGTGNDTLSSSGGTNVSMQGGTGNPR